MNGDAKIFVDTNILVYAHDVDAGEKYRIAITLLTELWADRRGTLSTQVLQEFYVTATRKIATPLRPAVARRMVARYKLWPVESIDVATIVDASEIAEVYQLSFWDGLILAAARNAGASTVFTEDLQSGQTIAGIRVVNPLVDTPEF